MDKSTKPTVRFARADDFEGIYELVDKALYHPSEMIMARYRNYPYAKSEHSIVVEADGKIVSHIRMYPCELYYGDIVVHGLSIGDVCTDPDYRKRGFGAMCLNKSIEWMKANNAVISLIYSGVLGFYKSVGWVDVPMESISVPIDSIAELPEKQEGILVRRFERANDLEGVAKVYEAYNRNRYLAAVRNKLWWRNSFHWITDENEEAFYVAEKHGQITAYSRMADNTVREICYNDFESALALWRGIVKWAKRWHLWGEAKPYKTISLRISKDNKLFEYLNLYKNVKVQSCVCKLLIRCADIPQLTDALSPLLMKRVPNDFEFVFEMDNQRFRLTKRRDIINIEKTDARADIVVDYEEFTRRLAGRREKEIATGTDAQTQIMEKLFPQFVQSVRIIDLA